MIYSNINNFLKAVSTKNRWAEGMFGIRQPAFFLTFLFSLSISAQFEPPTNAYLKEAVPQPTGCDLVNFNSVVPLKVNNVYRVYANVEEENFFFPEDIWLEDSSGDTYELTFQKTSNTFISEEIPKGKSVKLKYINGCSKIAEDRTSLTDYSLGQMITVSNKLFSLVAEINAYEKHDYVKILTSILEDNTVDDFEKLSFIQQYLLKGQSLNSTKMDRLDQHPGFQKMMNDCNCTVVTTYFTNTPGTHLQQVENQPSSRIITTDHTEGQSNELELSLHSSGPAKLWHLYSDGWKRNRNTWFGGAIGTQLGTGRDGFPTVDPIIDTYLNDGLSVPSEFTHNASIRMVLFCNNGVQTRECGCAKQIQPTAMYESEVGVRTQTLSGGGGTKRAMALAEDAFILYRQVMTGPNAGEFQLMGTDLNRASSTCNSDVNPEFFSSILSVVEDAAQIALGFTGWTPDSTADIRNQTTRLLNSIDTLGQTRPRIVSGECSFESEPRRYEPALTPFYLRPSEVTQFALASRSRGLSMGMRSWQSEVLIKTDYRLSIFQPRGTDAVVTEDEEEKIQCCTDKASIAWIYGVIDEQEDIPTGNMSTSSEPISSHFDMRAGLGDALFAQSDESGLFLYEQGRYFVPSQWGQLVGGVRIKEGCKVAISDEEGTVIIGPGSGGGKSFGSNNYETNRETDLNCRHMIFSVDGKKLGEVKATLIFDQLGGREVNTSLINEWFINKGLPSGVYLVSTVDAHSAVILPTKKIVVTK